MNLYDLTIPFILALSIMVAIPTGNYERYSTQTYHYEFPVLSAQDARTVIEDIESNFPSPFFAIRTTAHLYKISPLTKARTEVPMDPPKPPESLNLKLEWAK